MKKAIIVFQKHPKAGSVKTRLAVTIGAKKAANLYTLLIRHTHQQLSGLEAEIFVFHKGPISTETYPKKAITSIHRKRVTWGIKCRKPFNRFSNWASSKS